MTSWQATPQHAAAEPKQACAVKAMFAPCCLLLAALWLLSGCSAKSPPAPVTTLELRQNPYDARNRGSLDATEYVVQRGDTLYSIAFRAGQDVRTLAQRNNIASPYLIYPGQALRLQGAIAQQRQPAVQRPAQPSTSKPAQQQSARPAQPVSRQPTPARPAVTQPKSDTSSNSAKAVAPSKQTGYVQSSATQTQQKAAQPLATAGRVQWVWPVRGPIISEFSTAEHGNKGIDIAGAEGTRVNAAAAGEVVYAGNALRGYGNLIIIKHNDDYLSAYAHNKRILVKERQQVNAGQQIAEMGSTDATDSRLHFEIRFRGQSVNPRRYLPR